MLPFAEVICIHSNGAGVVLRNAETDVGMSIVGVYVAV